MPDSLLGRLAERIRSAAQPEPSKSPPLTLELAAAALLMEVAYADNELHSAEREAIKHAVMAQFDLDADTVEGLLQESAEAHADSVGVQAFTRALTDHWDEPQRYALVVALWRVALADTTIDALEEHRIRGIAELLYVSHNRFIEAKLTAKRDAQR